MKRLEELEVLKLYDSSLLYSIHAHGNYAGGMAVIAAENEKQAIDLIMKSDNSIFSIDWSQHPLG